MKIYISSTFQDLKDYRAKAYSQLRKLRHDVISMEDYVAGDQRPLARCLADVEECDVYVGVFAWRYGFVPSVDQNPDKLSITELEYRHAVSCGKPCLIFLLDKTVPWPPQLLDSHTGEGRRGKQIERLRSELAEQHSPAYFSNPDELASAIVVALVPLQFAEPPASSPVPDVAARELTRRTGRSSGREPGARAASPRPGFPSLWTPGDTLRVRFLDGSRRQRGFVERFAPLWSAYANITFEFGDDPDAEIRVSFTEPGSWAYIGPDALSIGEDSPTANFGWATDRTRDTEIDYTILHEFGHVLGLRHEHQNPAARIPWDEEALYRALGGPPNNWTRSAIRNTLLTPWTSDAFPFEKPFDADSIMAMPLPQELTGTDFATSQNMAFSVGDKEFVGRLYAFDDAPAATDHLSG